MTSFECRHRVNNNLLQKAIVAITASVAIDATCYYCNKMLLGTKVDLGPGHVILDGVPALREKGHSSPLFSAHVYCGHGHPSQLLLSSCFKERLFWT